MHVEGVVLVEWTPFCFLGVRSRPLFRDRNAVNAVETQRVIRWDIVEQNNTLENAL